MSKEKENGLSHQDRSKAEDRTSMRSPLIYEAIRREGIEELERPGRSLAWSGFAAGIAMSFSIYAKGAINEAAQGASWADLISNFGYCLGFVIVVMGRLQLFTENTITVVLPLLYKFTRERLICTLKLWLIVLSANLLGAFVSAFCAIKLGILPRSKLESVLEVSSHLQELSAMEVLAYGVPAGFLVAAMVWLMPGARGNEFLVIVSLTYLIGIGGWTHVIAGSTEWFMLALNQSISWPACFLEGLAPALAGNILGGTFLFALLSYGQVREEL